MGCVGWRGVVVGVLVLLGSVGQAATRSWGDSVRVAEYLAQGEIQKAQQLLDGMLDSTLALHSLSEELDLLPGSARTAHPLHFNQHRQQYTRQGQIQHARSYRHEQRSLAHYFGLRARYQRAVGNDLAALHDARAALMLEPLDSEQGNLRGLYVLMAAIYEQHGCHAAMDSCLKALGAMPKGSAAPADVQEAMLELRCAASCGDLLAMHRALVQIPPSAAARVDTLYCLERCLVKALLANQLHDGSGVHEASHEALSLLTGYSSPHAVRRYYHALSQLLLACGDTLEGSYHLRAAYRAIEAGKLDEIDALVIGQLARLEGARGRYRDAATTLERHEEGLDSIQRAYMGDVLTQRRAVVAQQHALAEKVNKNLQDTAARHKRRQNRHLYSVLALLATSLVYTAFRMGYRRKKKANRQREVIKRLSTQLQEESRVSAQVEALLERQEKLIEQRQEIQKYSLSRLSAHNAQLETSIAYVHNLQQALLPGDVYLRGIFGDCFLIYRPRDGVSGDCFWYAQSATHTILAMVDCAGHGIPGALMNFVAITLLRKVVDEWGLSDPAEILQTMHTQLRSYMREERSNLYGFYSMDVAVVKWIPQDRCLIFSGASSSIYVRQRGELKRYRGVLMSVGSTLVDRQYNNETIPIPEGCELYMATDGLSDQLDIHSRKLGYSTMMAILNATGDAPMAAQKAQLWQQVEHHRGTAEQTDDICCFGIRISPQP